MKMKFVKTASLAVVALVLVYAVAMFAGCKSETTAAAPAGPVAKRTSVEAFRADTDYIYIHGNASPDGTKLYVALNDTTPTDGGEGTAMLGQVTTYILDAGDLEDGTVSTSSIISTSTFSGMSTTATIAFRSSWTPDGTKIVQAGADRVFVLDSTTLLPLNGATGDTAILGTKFSFQNHDALAIDDDYAVLAGQTHLTSSTDGGVAAFLLYDLNTGAAVGSAVNACSTCHDETDTTNHFMCGIDGKLTKSGTTYTGTIYVASTSGGHVVKVPVTIDTTNTTAPITVGIQTRIQISDSEGTSAADIMPNFHDVRLDSVNNRVYYSAIKTDSTTGTGTKRAHMGYVDLADDSVHDATISATEPARAGLVYCGSGMNTTHFFPMTMSYPAYIDAVPKSLIVSGAAINP
jgi:hypothetical protein